MLLSNETVNDIYQELDTGMIVYLHKTTHEVLSTLDFEDPYAEEQMELWQETLDKLEANKDDYIEIEKMDSREAYKVMESFVRNAVTDLKMQGRLVQAIEGHKPFANFNHTLGRDMDLRDKWFEYKEEKYMEYVVELLSLED